MKTRLALVLTFLVLATVAAGTRYPASESRAVPLKGFAEPVEIVTVDWR